MICPQCHTENPDDLQSCSHCGAPLTPDDTVSDREIQPSSEAAHAGDSPVDDSDDDFDEENFHPAHAARPLVIEDRPTEEAEKPVIDEDDPRSVISNSLNEVRSFDDSLPDSVVEPAVFGAFDPKETQILSPISPEDVPEGPDGRETAHGLHEKEPAGDDPKDVPTPAEPSPAATMTLESGSLPKITLSLTADDLPKIESDDAEDHPLAYVPSVVPVPAPEEAARDSLASLVREMFPAEETSGHESSGADDSPVQADFRGLERLVDSSYVPPVIPARTGDTMQIPRITDDQVNQAKSFRAEMDPKEARRAAKAQKKQEKELKRQKRKDSASVGSSAPPAAPPVAEPTNSAPIKPASPAEPEPSVRDERFFALRRRRRFIVAAIVAAIVVAAALTVGLTYYFELWGGKVVPDVVGQSQQQATTVLEEHGFTVRATQVKSDEPEGTVLLTDPHSGARAPEGGEVVVHVAEPRVIPEIVGMSRQDAENALRQEGFDSINFAEIKSNEPEGVVLSVDPPAGTKARSSTPINVQVAIPYVVPDVANMSTDQARSALEAEGYTVEVAWYFTEDIPEGTAVSTDPPAGTKLNSGSEVTLNIARSRSAAVVEFTNSYFQSHGVLTLGGVPYQLGSVDDIGYIGYSTARYTITARTYETVNTLFFGSQTFYGSYQTITGTITWSDSGKITASDPVISSGS